MYRSVFGREKKDNTPSVIEFKHYEHSFTWTHSCLAYSVVTWSLKIRNIRIVNGIPKIKRTDQLSAIARAVLNKI